MAAHRRAVAHLAALGCLWLAASLGDDDGATAGGEDWYEGEDDLNSVDEEEGDCPAGDSSCAKGPTAARVSADQDLSWRPRTLSVVLPCASEGEFAKRTVESVSTTVPGGGGGDILVDIVVVDDGSKPPLSKQYLPESFRKKHGVILVRHEAAKGLIRAKAAGADAAKGDIIIFFDCHVAPQPGWYKEFLSASAVNYRRIVVPAITDLDIDTWTQRSQMAPVSKCYLTWDADFKWFNSDKPEIPVLSGGLLGISRRWWNETGGYDRNMAQWGGENIDQSLRTWLCGGEIVALPGAFVAHMWRRPEDPRTKTRYKVNPMNVIRNRVLAAKGWFGKYNEKVNDFPDFRYMASRGPYDVSGFREVQERLHCKPFAWFLWRFRDLYEGAGLLPEETFRIEHVKSGKCLTYNGPPGTHPQGKDTVSLQTCGAPSPGLMGMGKRPWPAQLSDSQRWHKANQDRSGKCCSGLRAWNTDQCLLWDGKTLTTVVCDPSGRHGNIVLTGEADSGGVLPGQLMNSDRQWGCLRKARGKLSLSPCLQGRGSSDEPAMWRKVAPEVPLETKLYREALESQPELYTE